MMTNTDPTPKPTPNPDTATRPSILERTILGAVVLMVAGFAVWLVFMALLAAAGCC